MIKLIVGLQNPGSVYAQTRHNAGGWLVSAIAARARAQFKKSQQGFLTTLDNNVKLFLPDKFMNQSGQALQALLSYYKINSQEILIAHDELDLAVGRVKLKISGGHGGHNGLRNIISHIGKDFLRLRIGISHPGHRDLVTDYVLKKPSATEKVFINDAIERVLPVLEDIYQGDIAKAMNNLNS